jgi:cell division protein FtsB
LRYLKKNYLIYIFTFSFVALLLAVWLIFGRHGLLDLDKMQKENERFVAVIKELKEKNKLLAAEIRRLREDREYLESVARKELGLVRDSEIIYRFKREWNGRGQGSGNKNEKQQ